MVFQLTNYCEMNCPHCMNSCTTDGEHSTMETIIDLCKFINQYNPKMLLIGGGEPTCHPDFIKYFEYILLNSKAEIITLITNGYFLYSKELLNDLIKLNEKYHFIIQITAVKGIYKKTKKTNELYNKVKKKFKYIQIVNEMTVIDQVGRAKGKDWSKFTTYKKKAPNCFNFLSCGYSPSNITFYSVIKSIQAMNHCKPFIDINGNVYIGETIECQKIGNIWDNDNTLYNNLISKEPCGNCEVPYKELIKYVKSQYRI